MTTVQITVWNEYYHERTQECVRAVYPEGIHTALKECLEEEEDFCVRTATLDEPEHGLTEEVLASTDVLLWWGHAKHQDVSDEIVERVWRRVMDGMGLIVLHSGHASKIFRRLMGTRSDLLKWRAQPATEKIWMIKPSHPIAAGVSEMIELEQEEAYGEFFDIPDPEEVVFASWFSTGEVFRSGCCFRRGYGKIFYFRPGHEEFPAYYHPQIRRILKNAVRWAAKDADLTVTKTGRMD